MSGDHVGEMVAQDVLAFAVAALPEPPTRLLEVGAGRGELAAALRERGHEVYAIDPAAERGTGVEPIPLLDADGTYDAALAVVSLHHVEPLAESCEHLGNLVRAGGRLVIDEFDVERFDRRAAQGWLDQRAALGFEEEHEAEEMVADRRDHIHTVATLREALAEWFEIGEPVPGPYLHRWDLAPGLRDAEERLIASGELPATGTRSIGVRRERP